MAVDEVVVNAGAVRIDSDPTRKDGQFRKLVSIIKRDASTAEDVFRKIIEIEAFDATVKSHGKDRNYQDAAEFAEKCGLGVHLTIAIPRLRDTGASEKQLNPLIDALRRINSQKLAITERIDSLTCAAGKDKKLFAETSERLRTAAGKKV